MTFDNVRTEEKQTVVFLPHHLRGTLVHFLEEAGIDHARVTSIAEGMRTAGLTEPPHIIMVQGFDRETKHGAAIISNFNAEDIKKKIYSLNDDPETFEYRDGLSKFMADRMDERGELYD